MPPPSPPKSAPARPTSSAAASLLRRHARGRRPVGQLAGAGTRRRRRHAGSSAPPGPPRALRAQAAGLPRSPPLRPHRRRGLLLRRPRPLRPEPQAVPARARQPHLHPEPQVLVARHPLVLLRLLLLRLPRRRGGHGARPAHGPPRAAVPGLRQPLPALPLPPRRRRARGRRHPPRQLRPPPRQRRPRRPLRHARRQPGLRHRAARPAPPPPPWADACSPGGAHAHAAPRLPDREAPPPPPRADAGAGRAGSPDDAHDAARLPGREARGDAQEHLHPLQRLPEDGEERQASRDGAGERRLAARVRGRGQRQGGGAPGRRRGEGRSGRHGCRRAAVRGVQPGHVQDGAVQQVGGDRGVPVRRPVPVRARHRRAPSHHPPPALQDPGLPHGLRRRPLPLRPPLPLPPLDHPRRLLPPPPPLIADGHSLCSLHSLTPHSFLPLRINYIYATLENKPKTPKWET